MTSMKLETTTEERAGPFPTQSFSARASRDIEALLARDTIVVPPAVTEAMMTSLRDTLLMANGFVMVTDPKSQLLEAIAKVLATIPAGEVKPTAEKK